MSGGRAQYRRAGDSGGGGGTGDAVVSWGSRTLASTTATRYLAPFVDDAMAPVVEVGWRAPRSGTLRDLYVRHGTPLGNGNIITYTLRVAGVDSTVLVALASTGGAGQDTTNSVSVNAGDLVSIKVTKASGVGASPRDIVVTATLD